MELRQLTYFSVVAEELHFGRAAERLHISQPPLSVQIRKLEQELGTPLLLRSTRRVELTPAGAELQARLAQLLPLLHEAVGGLDEVRSGARGRLTAGFVSSASYTLLPASVRRFRTERPQVELRLVPLTSAEQLERIQEGVLDVAIVRDPSRDIPFHRIPLRSERLVACMAADHPLAARARIHPAELLDSPFIGYPRHLMPGYVDLVHSLFDAERQRPRYAQKVIHQETALGFIATGEGISVLPAGVREQLPASIRAVELDTELRSETAAITAGAEPANPAAQAFLDCLLAVAGALELRDPRHDGEGSPVPQDSGSPAGEALPAFSRSSSAPCAQ